jgi:hypothetical protein
VETNGLVQLTSLEIISAPFLERAYTFWILEDNFLCLWSSFMTCVFVFSDGIRE